MSDPLTPQYDADSIFAGAPEEPEAGALTFDGEVVPGDDEPVREVTESGNLKMKVPLGDIDPYDHSSEEDAKRAHQAKLGVAPPLMPDTVAEPIRNPAMMQDTNDPLQVEMERRFSQTFGEMNVTVTATERDAFVRAALHDEELILDIKLEGVDATIQVAIPSDEFTNSASAAVTRWGQEDIINKDSDLQWLLAFQQIHAWFQIRAVNGIPTPWSDFWAGPAPSIRDIRAAMKDPNTFDEIVTMNAVRWRMMLDAIRIAELKYKICLENWRDRSFFAGADTD